MGGGNLECVRFSRTRALSWLQELEQRGAEEEVMGPLLKEEGDDDMGRTRIGGGGEGIAPPSRGQSTPPRVPL